MHASILQQLENRRVTAETIVKAVADIDAFLVKFGDSVSQDVEESSSPCSFNKSKYAHQLTPIPKLEFNTIQNKTILSCIGLLRSSFFGPKNITTPMKAKIKKLAALSRRNK
jgi:hypothetical protein